MPPAHLIGLPGELIARIASYLSLNDICNLRQTCGKAEHDTFFVFAQRGFTTTTITIPAEGLPSLSQAYGSKQLAMKTSNLQLQYPLLEHSAGCRQYSDWSWVSSIDDAVPVTGGKPDPCEFLLDLPNLSSLLIAGSGSGALSQHLPAAEFARSIEASGVSLKSVRLCCGKVSETELLQFLDFLRREHLKVLRLTNITLHGGNWKRVLRLLQDFECETIKFLNLHTLPSSNSPATKSTLLFPFGLGPDGRSKWFRGEGGLSHYWMKEATMFMHRSEGIQAGLDVLLSRVGLQ